MYGLGPLALTFTGGSTYERPGFLLSVLEYHYMPARRYASFR
jgi:hypothetical protein